jgi:hypothetical protein
VESSESLFNPALIQPEADWLIGRAPKLGFGLEVPSLWLLGLRSVGAHRPVIAPNPTKAHPCCIPLAGIFYRNKVDRPELEEDGKVHHRELAAKELGV